MRNKYINITYVLHTPNIENNSDEKGSTTKVELKLFINFTNKIAQNTDFYFCFSLKRTIF